jgi:hypothetical protein
VSEQLKIFTCKIVESVLSQIDTPIKHDKLEINNDEENLRSKICEEHDDFNVLPW